VIAYQILSGVQPFSGSSVAVTMKNLLVADCQPLSSFVPSIDVELSKIVSQALAKNPTKRFQSAEELVLALEGMKREEQ